MWIDRPLVIASRKSDLARWQAYRVGERLQSQCPSLEIKYKFSASLGDKNLDVPLWSVKEKGIFTQDFLKDLEQGEVDLVVHSWKDLPVDPRPTTLIGATIEREDMRDLLLVKKKNWPQVVQTQKLKILTSSPRRMYNLESFLPQALPALIESIEFVDVRGNIPTRMKKMLEGEEDALVVAKAALDRLLNPIKPEFEEVGQQLRRMLTQCYWMVLPLSQNPSAAAQGALAIEVLKDRPELEELLEKIHKPQVYSDVLREREILASYGGGCHQKIGVSHLTRKYGRVSALKGLTDSGQILNEFKLEKKSENKPANKSENKRSTPISKDSVWPLNLKNVKNAWFERKDKGDLLDSKLKLLKSKSTALWVSRANALPTQVQPEPDQVVWAAGLSTWRQLAQRGVWVHGCAESLGEQELPRLERILTPSTEWVKVTHQLSAQNSWFSQVIPTYDLVPLAEGWPDLTTKKYFYWQSGSSFKRALELFPTLREGDHACGPGRTYDTLRKCLGDSANVSVFLNHQDWLDSFEGFDQPLG